MVKYKHTTVNTIKIHYKREVTKTKTLSYYFTEDDLFIRTSVIDYEFT